MVVQLQTWNANGIAAAKGIAAEKESKIIKKENSKGLFALPRIILDLISAFSEEGLW